MPPKYVKLPAEALVPGHIIEYNGIRVAVDTEPTPRENNPKVLEFYVQPMDIIANPYQMQLNRETIVKVENDS